MARGYVKKVFPGNNTSQGFKSFYDYIIPPDATRVLIIKGGPGVGKSTFMSRIAEEMLNRGYDIEMHCCASDVGSLDGILIPKLGVAIMDGMAPHTMDPKYPGALEEIIYLGEYWDSSRIKPFKEKIMEISRESSRMYKRGYRFLKAAQLVYRDWEEANMEAMDFAYANQQTEELHRELFADIPVSSQIGYKRHLFARAITPEGMLNYVDTIIGPCSVKYVIEGEPGTGKSTLIEKIATAALERGYTVELYHCPLNPEKVEHIVIKELDVALTKSIEPHRYCYNPGDRVINLNEGLNQKVVAKYTTLVNENREMFFTLFNQAIKFIGRAKEHHDRLETYYTPYMDFAAIARRREEILQEILAYAEEVGAAGS
ncbi:MAG: PRK06851 family protein [Bacillota bacterium]|jgi:GTPase SAR1 family protein|nr:PRK06851 family protein [Bacillota bacterium]